MPGSPPNSRLGAVAGHTPDKDGMSHLGWPSLRYDIVLTTNRSNLERPSSSSRRVPRATERDLRELCPKCGTNALYPRSDYYFPAKE